MIRRIVVISLAVVVLVAAAPRPSIDTQGTAQSIAAATARPGDFVWHDLVTDNPAACRAFYAALFGWTFEAGAGIDPGYIIIKNNGRRIGGVVRRARAAGEEAGAQWLTYLVVQDVDKASAAFRDAGGRIFRGPLTAMKDLRVAAVADPQGAPLGLASRGPQSDAPRDAAVHEWLWMEYVARDPESALKFYGDVAGFKHEVSEQREDFTYYMLSTDRPRAGLFRTVWKRETSAWLPYVRVEDPVAMAARATQLGGTVVLAPQPRVRNNSLAVILDPAGAAVALQKFPFANEATP
jgi:predicted enzyme related to lactoylglutathione lyase